MDEGRRAWVIKRLQDYQRQKEVYRVAQATINDLRREIGGIKSQALNDMPHGTDTSDPTYQQLLQLPGIYRQISDLEQESEAAKAEIEIIDNALLRLNPAEGIVIKAMYTAKPPAPKRKKTYRELSRESHYAESTLMNAHSSALKKIDDFCRIVENSRKTVL